jgi:translation elongation factor EF-1alpha
MIDLICVPIAGITGNNIREPIDEKLCSCYKELTLLILLDTIGLEKRFPDGTLTIRILDRMKDKDLIVH